MILPDLVRAIFWLFFFFADCGSHPPGDSDPGTDRLTKRAVLTGNQTDQGCDSGEICCGGGPENCICPSPKIKDKKGQCRGIIILIASIQFLARLQALSFSKGE